MPNIGVDWLRQSLPDLFAGSRCKIGRREVPSFDDFYECLAFAATHSGEKSELNLES